jgi:acyl-coenzyme A synthetase/AMP-(fatty) acid ligase
LAERLPYYAVPELLEFMEALPRNASGRVMKDQLRKRGMTPDTLVLSKMGIDAKNRAKR